MLPFKKKTHQSNCHCHYDVPNDLLESFGVCLKRQWSHLSTNPTLCLRPQCWRWSNTIGNHFGGLNLGGGAAKWGHTLEKATDGENVVNVLYSVQPQHPPTTTTGYLVMTTLKRGVKWRVGQPTKGSWLGGENFATLLLLCLISTSPKQPKCQWVHILWRVSSKGGWWTLGVPKRLHCERGSEKQPMSIVWFAILASHGWPNRGQGVADELLAKQLVLVLGSTIDQVLCLHQKMLWMRAGNISVQDFAFDAILANPEDN